MYDTCTKHSALTSHDDILFCDVMCVLGVCLFFIKLVYNLSV